MPIAGAPSPGRLGERVVAVIVGLAPPDREEHFLEKLAVVGEVDRRAESVFELHVVDEDGAVRTASHFEGAFADHLEADVFQYRHAAGKRHRLAVVIDLQRRPFGRLAGVAVIVDGDRLLRTNRRDAAGIEQRLGRGERAAIAFGKPPRDGEQRGVGAGSDRRLAQRILPGADDVADRFLDRRLLDLGRPAAGTADDEMDARQAAFGKGRIIGGEAAFEDGLEIGADLLADNRIVAVARHEDDDGDETVELVDAVERPDPGTLDEAEDRLGMLAQRRHRDLEQLVARIAFEHVDQRLAGMVVRDRSPTCG